VVLSAFNSAGQRCSALRVLFLQEEIADRVLRLLAGYMDEMVLGDPALLATDVGPVIAKPRGRCSKPTPHPSCRARAGASLPA